MTQQKAQSMDNNNETDLSPKRKDRRIRPPENQQISNRKKLPNSPRRKKLKNTDIP